MIHFLLVFILFCHYFSFFFWRGGRGGGAAGGGELLQNADMGEGGLCEDDKADEEGGQF